MKPTTYCMRLTALALLVGLPACQSVPPDGAYTAFLTEVMVTSAKLKQDAGKGPKESRQAARAVAAWRGTDSD